MSEIKKTAEDNPSGDKKIMLYISGAAVIIVILILLFYPREIKLEDIKRYGEEDDSEELIEYVNNNYESRQNEYLIEEALRQLIIINDTAGKNFINDFIFEDEHYRDLILNELASSGTKLKDIKNLLDMYKLLQEKEVAKQEVIRKILRLYDPDMIFNHTAEIYLPELVKAEQYEKAHFIVSCYGDELISSGEKIKTLSGLLERYMHNETCIKYSDSLAASNKKLHKLVDRIETINKKIREYKKEKSKASENIEDTYSLMKSINSLSSSIDEMIEGWEYTYVIIARMLDQATINGTVMYEYFIAADGIPSVLLTAQLYDIGFSFKEVVVRYSQNYSFVNEWGRTVYIPYYIAVSPNKYREYKSKDNQLEYKKEELRRIERDNKKYERKVENLESKIAYQKKQLDKLKKRKFKTAREIRKVLWKENEELETEMQEAVK